MVPTIVSLADGSLELALPEVMNVKDKLEPFCSLGHNQTAMDPRSWVLQAARQPPELMSWQRNKGTENKGRRDSGKA